MISLIITVDKNIQTMREHGNERESDIVARNAINEKEQYCVRRNLYIEMQ
jgi:hypothetical protein